MSTDVTPTLNLKSLKKGTVLFLECESDLYEITLLQPEHGVVEISSNLPALRQGTVGQFICSVQWSHPGTRLNVIQQGWAAIFRFCNGEYQTQPVVSASIRGKRTDGSRWSYEVF